jgi:Carboxypeptidase regulatory-like domain
VRLSIVTLLITFSIDAQVIRGRIVDADAKPVAGAQVQVTLADRSSLDFASAETAITSEDGRYEIVQPPFTDTERASLAITVPAHATVRSQMFHVSVRDLQMDVTLPRFEPVPVRVTSKDGKPVPKARVAFASSEETVSLRGPEALLMRQYEKRATVADDAGEVVLHLLPGTWDFAAVADGFQAATIAERTIKRGANVAIALEPAFSIRGRVHRGGVGVADANVFLLMGERRTRDEKPIVTDADGAFEIGGLSRGDYRISIVKTAEMVHRIVETKAPSDVDVALPPAGVLRARVIDRDTREPVRQAMTFFQSIDAPDTPHLDRRAEDGTLNVVLTTGTYRMTTMAMGYGEAQPVELRITEREPAEITIELDRGITISGTVTDDHGAPVAAADVHVVNNVSGGRRTHSARTAEDGTFSVSGFEAGQVSVSVRKNDFVPFQRVVDADADTTVDVQLAHGRTIEGIVRRNGRPAEGVTVSAVTSALGGSEQNAVTGADGRFVLRGLIDARYAVSAYTENAHAQARDVEPSRTRELVLSLDPAPGGVVYGVITSMPANLGGKITRRVVFAAGFETGVEAMIDDSGNYRIEDVPAGTVTLTVQLESTLGSRSSAPKRIEVVAGREHRVDLDLGADVVVRGRITMDGKPLGGVRIVFTKDDSIAASTTSRTTGAYEVALPAAGPHRIFVHSDSLSAGNVQLGRDIRGGETIDVDLREQAVEGTVVDAVTKEPLSGVFVSIVPEIAVAEWWGGEVMTGATGRFRILTAATGPHRIAAWVPGYAQRTLPIQLGRTAPAPVAFELSKAGEFRVRVFDAKSGTPLSAHVAIADAPVRLDRHADGVTLVGSLAPGRYRITVVVPGYADKTVEVTAPGTIDVTME